MKKSTLRIAITLAAAALGAAALLAPGAGARSVASASKGCNVNQRAYGHDMYLTSLSARHTSCRKGKAVVKGYTKCRYKHGGLNGHCPNRVARYKCGEGKRTIAPHIQYSVNVACKRGARRIKFSYTQQV